MKVLIIKISSMGDIINTLPALTDVKNKIPCIKFDWVVEEDFVEIPNWHPAVNKVIPLAIRRWKKKWWGKKEREERLIFKKILQSNYYDFIIDAQGLIKSSFFVTRLARGIKHGFDKNSVREKISNLWYDKTYFINKKQHSVERNRELFSKVFSYKKPKHKGKYSINHNFISLDDKKSCNYIIFLYATTKKNKHWSENNWISLIKSLKYSKLRIKLFWWKKHEFFYAKRLASSFNYVDILPKLNLYEIGQQIIGARAIVSVDTGLSNLASALNIPNIILYGPTTPKLNGGYGKNQQTIIAPKNNLSKLESSIVSYKLKKLLQQINL